MRAIIVMVSSKLSRVMRQTLLLTVLLCATRTASAEGGCPEGLYPIGGGNGGWTSCAPIPGNESSPNAAVESGPQWATRWGAIAVDGNSGSFGGVDGLPSKRKAEKMAIRNCKKNGGQRCEVLGAYYDQCGAMAWGATKVTSYRSADLSEASSKALETCSQASNSCKVYYSGCSYPVRVR